MYKVIRGLRNGINYDLLDNEEKKLINQLREAKIVYNTRYKAKNIYKYADNVTFTYDKERATFEVFPARVIGVFFEYDELFECKSDDKQVPKVYFLGYAINPDKDIVENFNLGNTVKVKVLARGYNASNEGLLVRLPSSEEEYFNIEGQPCITIGTAGKGKFKDTGKLNFDEEIENGKFLVGRKGIILGGEVYYNIKDVNAMSSVYCLDYKKSDLKKIEEKKMYRR